MFEKLGSVIHRHRWLVLAIASLILTLSAVMLRHGGRLSSGSFRTIEAERAQQWAQEALGHPPDATFVVLLRSRDLEPDSDAFQDAVRRAMAPLRSSLRVASVVTPEDAPTFLLPSMVNKPARAVLAFVTLSGSVPEALDSYPSVRGLIVSDRLEVSCTGYLPFMHDLNLRVMTKNVRGWVQPQSWHGDFRSVWVKS